MVSVIQDPGATEVCRDRLLHITTRRLSQSLLSLNGFEEVRSSPAVKILCGWKGHSESVADLSVAWLCGAGTERLCSILATAEDNQMAVRDMASKLFYASPAFTKAFRTLEKIARIESWTSKLRLSGARMPRPYRVVITFRVKDPSVSIADRFSSKWKDGGDYDSGPSYQYPQC